MRLYQINILDCAATATAGCFETNRIATTEVFRHGACSIPQFGKYATPDTIPPHGKHRLLAEAFFIKGSKERVILSANLTDRDGGIP